jgi:hypothetical protein
MMTMKTTTMGLGDEDNNDNDDNDGTRQQGATRGTDAPPFLVFFFLSFFLFYLHLIFYSTATISMTTCHYGRWQWRDLGGLTTGQRRWTTPSFGGCSVDYVIKVLD